MNHTPAPTTSEEGLPLAWQLPYQIEARIYARYILQNERDAKIGVLYQNDDYGKEWVRFGEVIQN